MPIIRSISGLRASLADGLSPSLIANYTAAFAAYCPAGKIVIGSDGRQTGAWIYPIVKSTLLAMGREILDLGIVPTPTVQFIVEKQKASGGIVVTASHNPSNWNGLKFLNQDGIFLDANENKAFWEILDENKYTFSANSDIPNCIDYKNAKQEHINSILTLSILNNNSIAEKLQKLNLKIVVDAVNASGSEIVPSLLSQLNCNVISLHCDKSGVFPHTPEPLEINLRGLSEAVKLHKADMGIAVDPDADRLVIVDEKGNFIGEEKTIVLAALLLLKYSDTNQSEIQDRKICINLSTSKMIEVIANRYNTKVLRSPVGEINVVKLMKESGAFFGGEGSGGVILADCHYGRDSLVGIGLILSLVALENKSLSEIDSQIPKFEMVKLKKEFVGSIDSVKNILLEKFKNEKIDLQDGIRIDFPNSWVQLRTSNTEPIIRAIAEAETLEEANSLAEDILALI